MNTIIKPAKFEAIIENLRHPRGLGEGNNYAGAVYFPKAELAKKLAKLADKLDKAEVGEEVNITNVEAKSLIMATYVSNGMVILPGRRTNEVRKLIAKSGNIDLAFIEVNPHRHWN